MPGFTKLFSTIVTSSIWSEDDQTRILWITLLALCDEEGVIQAALPGIASSARIPLPKCVQLLEKLESPDKFSRNQGHEGRRIEKIPGTGMWRVLNYVNYRNLRGERSLSTEPNSVYHRDYMRRKRARDKLTKSVPLINPSASASVPEGPEGAVNRNGNGNTVEVLALEAHRAFPGAVHRASAGVLSNVHDLLDAGHTPERLRKVFEWAGKPGEYKPRSPLTLTDPDKFQGWLKAAMEATTEQRREPNI